MRKKLILLLACIFLPALSYATITGLNIVSITPNTAAVGSNVQVVIDYCAAAYEQVNILLAVSDNSSTVLRADNTLGQTYVVSASGVNVPSATSGAGYAIPGSSQSTAYCASITWTITIPTVPTEGGTFNMITGAKGYDVRYDTANMQAYLPFTIPLPPASASVTKTAEASTVVPGDLILYTVNYNYVNSNSLTITDVVPAGCTLVQQSSGGTSSGTAAGSALTWALPATGPRKADKVWFLVRTDVSQVPGTVIHNTADWTLVDTFSSSTSGTSNDAPVTVIPAFAFSKSQDMPVGAQVGDTVTYTLSVTMSGYSLKSYDAYDTAPSDYFMTGTGPLGFNWVNDSPGGHMYSNSQGPGNFPHYLKTSTSNFCYGIIQVDAMIPAVQGDQDALIVFRDDGLSPSTAYGVGISIDDGPGYLFLQKTNTSGPILVPGTWNYHSSPNSPGVWYTIKVQVTDAGGGTVRLQAKKWIRGTTEPAGWMIDVIDSTGPTMPGCGYVGLQGYQGNQDNYDNLSVVGMSPMAMNAVVFDTVPAAVTYIDGTGATAQHSAAVNTAGIVNWTFPNLVTNYTDTLQWWGTINACGLAITNIGSIKANFFEGIINSTPVSFSPNCPGTPTVTETITPTFTITVTRTLTITPTITQTITPSVTPTIAPLLNVQKSVSPSSGEAGTTVLYTIRVTNNTASSITVNNVNVWDTLPSKHSFVSSASGTYNAGTNMITFGPVLTLAAGSYIDYSFTAVVLDTITKNEKLYNTAMSGCDSSVNNFVSNQTSFSAIVPDLVLNPEVTVPNPTDGPTTIIYTLSVKADVTIKIFTVSGELIRTIDDIKGVKGTNKTFWDGLNEYNQKAASGVYIYKIEAVSGSEKKHVFSKLAVTR